MPLSAQQPVRIITETPIKSWRPDSIALKDARSNAVPRRDSIITDIIYSKDSLDVPVDYGSKDSIYFDNKNNLVHLYGAAFVNYRTLTLTANYIVIDLKNNVANAQPLPDSAGILRGYPSFKDGTQDFTAKGMKYNFKTKKGLITDVVSKQNDIFVHGGVSKFVSSSPVNGDTSKKSSDVIYSSQAIFTTCSADHPHFGIVSAKQKLIPNKLIVVGPSNLVIGDVPTPLWLPFAAFPLAQGKRTGLIFPQDYEYSQQWGFGLRNLGWYFPITDNYDLTLQGDIYWRGTFGVRANQRYLKKYKYNGALDIGYNNTIKENSDASIGRESSWSIRWSHAQDTRANPTFSFNSSVNIQWSKSKDPQRSNYTGITYNDYASATRSQLSSSISFTKTFPNKPYSLSGSVQHSQNVTTRDVQLSLPNLDFTMQTIFPFKQKQRVGNEKWYEKVSLQYSGSLQNRIQTKDSLFLTAKMFDKAQFGVRHQLSSNVNFNILKYFNFSPSVSYAENWYLKQTNLSFDPTNIKYKIDTSINPNNIRDTVFVKNILQNGKIDTNFKIGRAHV